MSVTRKRKDFEAAIIANKWEDLRPCYKNDDVSPKIIEMVLSKYNPAVSNNDKYNDLIKLEENSKLSGLMNDIRQRMPVAFFNETQVDYMFNITKSTNPSVKRKQIKKAVNKLANEKIILDDRGGIEIYGIFPFIKYTPEDKINTLIAEFNYRLLPYVLDLRNQTWSVSRLCDVRALTSDYAIKLYHFCIRYDKIRADKNDYIIEIKADVLRQYLNVSAGYSTVNFHLRILKKYLQEITEKTSINVSYDTVSEGRKIVKYLFHVTFKNAVKPRKEYVEGFAGRGIDVSLIDDENKELFLYLSRKGVNREQIFEIYSKYGINYMRYLTKKADYYNDKKPVKNYGSMWYGASKTWVLYDEWAKNNADVIAKEKEEKKQKQEAVEADEAVKKQDKIKEEKRKRLRSFEQFKNYTDSQLDNFIDICNSVLDTKEIKQEVKEVKEVKKVKKAKKKDLSTVNNMLLDYFVNEDFDVKKLLSHSYNIYFKMEQDKAGYDDFDDFVNDVKEAYYRGELD